MSGISLVAVQLAASQEGLYSMNSKLELVLVLSAVFRLGFESNQPPIQLVSGAVSLQGREAVHFTPSSDMVRNAWSCTSTATYFFMIWWLLN
jgi:hypothetical protein